MQATTPLHTLDPLQARSQDAPLQSMMPWQVLLPPQLTWQAGPLQLMNPPHEFVACEQSIVQGAVGEHPRLELQTPVPMQTMRQGTCGGQTMLLVPPTPQPVAAEQVIVQTPFTHLPTPAQACSHVTPAFPPPQVGPPSVGPLPPVPPPPPPPPVPPPPPPSVPSASVTGTRQLARATHATTRDECLTRPSGTRTQCTPATGAGSQRAGPNPCEKP